MLSDILKALELLTKGLKGVKSIDRKRRKIAKQLVKIYLGIEDVVERGNSIVSLLDEHANLTHSITLGMLVAQQEALGRLSDYISNEDISTLLRIQLPAFGNLKGLLETKQAGIAHFGFLLSQLIADEEPNRETIRRVFADYDHHLIASRPTEIGIIEAWIMRDLELEAKWRLRESEESQRRPLPDVQKVQIPVGYTLDQIRQVRKTLAQISQLAEELRQFLVEKFKIEDIL